MNRFWKEVGQMLDHKIEQGAAELAHGLMSNGSSPAYLPYGMNNQSPGIEDAPQPSWQEQLREASQRPSQQQHEMER